jgi:hypothetical protein
MSVGPLGHIVSSLAGSQSSQGSADTARVRQEVINRDRQVQADHLAADASGVAEPDGQSHQANDRDADGRRPWELPAAVQPEAAAMAEEHGPRLAKDLSGQSGSQLDVSG